MHPGLAVGHIVSSQLPISLSFTPRFVVRYIIVLHQENGIGGSLSSRDI